jgi:glycosyltransferase family protein
MQKLDVPNTPKNRLSVIVFSKNRPMQLHAYLESLLLFSDATQEVITVIYNSDEAINYDKVKAYYRHINWRKEEHFNSDLLNVLSISSEHILFGCDDVVFTRGFSLSRISRILDENENIFGFSLRLGPNIVPKPDNIGKEAGCYEWNWRESKDNHYNYPWELDCTIYRKSDVLTLLSNVGCLKNPNYLEERIAAVALQTISRSHLICSSEHSHALVITVNRVQDTHLNPIYQCSGSDVNELNKLYNCDNVTLNVRAIANKENNRIHVGKDYFILAKHNHVPGRNQKKGRVSLKTFFKNIRYLFKHEFVTQWELSTTIDNYKYEISAELQELAKPKIKTPFETIMQLSDSSDSLCRYGDGELIIMGGGRISFQEYDQKLAQRLREIIISNNKHILIGIPHALYNSTTGLKEEVKRFFRTKAGEIRSYASSVIDYQKEYVATECSQLYATYDQYDFINYFIQIKRIWAGQDITIISGENVFKNIKFNIFASAKSIDYLYAPSLNAYRSYSEILTRAQKIDKSRLVIIILGPTATVLAYDLSLSGYRALDLGHVSKDFDWYIKCVRHTKKTLTNFFKPD